MKKFFLICLVIFLVLPILVLAQSEKKKAVYFYSETCPRCLNVEKYFKETGASERYDIQKLNTHQSENFEKLNALFAIFGVEESKRGVPVIFFDRKFLAGDVPIIQDFSEAIENSRADFFPDAEIIENLSQVEKEAANQSKKYVANIPLSIVVSAALVDFFSPCSMVIFFILLAILFSSRLKKDILQSGLFFVLAVFLSHFLLAFKIYSFSGSEKELKYFSIGVGILIILIGFINLRYVVWRKKNRIFENKKVYRLTLQWHKIKENILKKLSTHLGVLVAGFICSLLLFSFTNESYQVIVTSLKEEQNWMKMFGIILFYNLIFIAPFLLSVWLLEKFSKTKKFALFGEKIFGLIKIFLGVIMIFVGVYLILSQIN